MRSPGARPAKHAAHVRQTLAVCIGHANARVGTLTYVKQGARENSAFAYDATWLARSDCFAVSPDLALTPDYQFRRAPSREDSVFHHAIADTEPDAWGRRVIARDHAKRRATEALPALTELDYLMAVDDFSRLGALRLQDPAVDTPRLADEGRRTTPPLVDLRNVYEATRAVELSRESAADLRYLLGKGTSLGGLRPKCTVLDVDGRLSLGKFPSVDDERDVTRGEILALTLARNAGIDVATARIEVVEGTAIGIIARFDRTSDDRRIPYLSAASLLQASRREERAYTEIVDAIRAHGYDPIADARQLWRRLAFNLLITNVDDHLHNLGFLHVEKGLWRLSPAFDVNPFPDRDNESKTWLSEEDGPVTSVSTLLARAPYFSLDPQTARSVLGEIVRAVSRWRSVARSREVGLSNLDLAAFEPAFEHAQMREARAHLP